MSAPTPIVPFPAIPEANQQSVAPPTVAQVDATLASAALASVQIPPATIATPANPISHPNKEVAPIIDKAPIAPETTRLVEVREQEPLPEEVEGWLQKLDQEGDIKLDKPITQDGDILLANTEAQVVKEKIVLPMSQSAAQQGLTKKVTESARWLAEWCVRLIKVMKDRVKYAPEEIKST
jgi:hypothetical protein